MQPSPIYLLCSYLLRQIFSSDDQHSKKTCCVMFVCDVGRSCSGGRTYVQSLSDGQTIRRGFLQSPNWPGEYPAGVDCEWTISAERGRHILLVVSRVDLASGDISGMTDEHRCSTTSNSSLHGDWLFIADNTGDNVSTLGEWGIGPSF